MKKVLIALVVVALMVGSYVCGAMQVIHSEGWLDTERAEFVVDWAGHAWAWDISEE